MEVNANGPSSSNSAGSDFIILSRVSSNSNHGDSPVNLEHLTFSLTSLANELTLEDAIARLRDLMAENQELKNTVMQNNEAMRNQCVILDEWKKKNDIFQKDCLNKYNQARGVVTTLRQQKSEAEKRIQALEVEIREASTGTTGTDILQLQQRIEDLEQMNTKLKKDAGDSNDLIEALNVEIQNLKKGPKTPSTGDVAVGDSSLAVKGELHTLKVKQEAAEARVLEYEHQVELLQEETKALQQENQGLTEKMQEVERGSTQIAEQMAKLDKQNKDLKTKCDELSTDLTKMREMQQRVLLEKKDLLTLNTQLQSDLSELKQTAMTRSAGTDDFSMVEKGECSSEQNMAASEREAVEVEYAQRQGQGHAQAVSKSGQGQGRIEDGGSAVDNAVEEERQKVLTLTAQFQEAQAKIESLRQDLEDKERELSQNVSNTDARIEKLTDEHGLQVKELMGRIENMTKELKQVKDKNPEEGVQSLRTQLMSVLSELQDTQSRCSAFEQRFLTTNQKQETAEANFEKERARCKEMEVKMRQLQVDLDEQRNKDDTVIDQMRITITNLDHALTRDRQEKCAAEHQLGELRQTFDQLCKDYHELLSTFDEYKESKQSGMTPQIQQENRELKIHVDNLTAQLIAAEESLDNKRTEMDNLRQQVGQLQTEVEAIPVWKAQADVFRKDFEAEREAREQQNEEKETLRRELNQQQVQNQQLLDELETYNRRQLETIADRYRHQPHHIPGVNYPPRNPWPHQHLPPQQGHQGHQGQQAPRQPHLPYNAPYFRNNYLDPDAQDEENVNEAGPRSGDSAQSPGAGRRRSTSSDGEEYVCPKCFENFPDHDSLMIHVNRCLD